MADTAPMDSARADRLKEELFGNDLILAEVEHILGLHRTTVQRYLRTGVLHGYQVGRDWRIPIESLRAFHASLLEQRGKNIESSP